MRSAYRSLIVKKSDGIAVSPTQQREAKALNGNGTGTGGRDPSDQIGVRGHG